MIEDRAPLGLPIAALGSVAVAVGVFLPWYSVSITAAGAAAAQQQFASVAQQYGNATLQTMASQIGAGFNSVAGRPLVTVSAHEALKYVSAVLLLLAGISLLASLLRLAGMAEVRGDQIALAGFGAVLLVLFRMLDTPSTHTGLVSLSLSWGIWLALAGAAAIAIGGVWSSPSAKADELDPSYPL